MNAATILAIPENEPERLFRHEDTVLSDYKKLLRRWHPDLNPGNDEAARVTAHITSLFRMVRQRMAMGKYQPPGEMEFKAKDGSKRFKIRYRARRDFELGRMYIGSHLLAFQMGKQFEDQAINGLKHIGLIRYPNDKFRTSLEGYMPSIVRSIETADGWVFVMRKEPNEVLLSDLIKHQGGQIEPRHIAWIISSLLNLLCFLQVNEIAHNGLTPATVFVNPQRHSAALYGGWWYASGFGKLLRYLPPETHLLASDRLLKHKVATGELDLQCIKAIGRACLGDPSGGSLRGRADVPAPFTQFLQLPPAKTAVAEYENWPKVLEASFGPRRFHELKVTGEDVYPQEIF